jgi:hypothetical protein
MNFLDIPESGYSTTSGLGSPTQVVSGTAVPIARAETNSSAVNAPVFVEIVVPEVEQNRALQVLRSPAEPELSWKRMAALERKRVARRRLKAEDVERAIETERYGK